MKKAAIALVVVSALVGAAACSSSSSSKSSGTTGSTGDSTTSSSGSSSGSKTASEPLRILVLAATSVPAEADGQNLQVAAAKAAVAELNAAGGVLGKPVQLDVQDTAGNPTTAVTKLNSAVNGGSKPAAIVQADVSTTAAAILPLTTQNKIVTLNSSTTGGSGDPTKYPYNFDLDPSNDSLAAAFCPAMKAMGAKSFGLIHQDDTYADTETDAVSKTCQAAGLTLVGNQKYKVDALDVTPQLAALQAKKPDVLMASTFGAPAGYLLQGLNKLGWKVPVLGDAAVMASPVVTSDPPTGMLGTASEANLKCLVYASTAYSASQPQNVTDLIAGLKKIGSIKAPLINAFGWDDVMLAAAGATAAGTTTDGAKIAAAIQSLPAGTAKTAVFPSYSFTATSHSAEPDPTSFTFVKPTKLVDGQFGNPSGS